MITQEELDDAILTITGRPEWETVATFLVSEALTARDMAADAPTLDQVKRLVGYAEGIAYVVRLREMTEQALENHDGAV